MFSEIGGMRVVELSKFVYEDCRLFLILTTHSLICMWIPFFWGFMFTGVMKVKQPKESRFLYKIPEKPNFVLISAGIVLMAIDIFVFGPGIYFN